ncbi:MAG: VWA domain-containing protein [Planctomycetaceae bacterium]|nr:VWA domain-containing protein [Planctomycetaceae bacterium]
MGFNLLNTPLAWGALAFCVPLILHILNRSRFRRVEWGAMHLLDSVVKVNHRRFQLEQLLLLLVRCLIPAILAFTLARPVLTGAAAPAGNTPTSLVVVLDNSYSMQATDETGSRYKAAVSAATDIIAALPRGSDVSVIAAGGAAHSLLDTPVFDTEAVCRKLRASDATLGAGQFRDSLTAALTTLAGMNNTRRELVVISDFQSADWADSTLADDISRQASALSFQPELTLLSVASDVAENMAVESIRLPAVPVGKGQPFLVRAELRNRSTTSGQVTARAFVEIDGDTQSVTDVVLASDSTSQVTFPVQIEEPGSHIVTVRLDVDDSLPADNQSSVAINIRDSLDVLLVDGDPSAEPLQSETDFLSIALTPFHFGGLKLSDLIATRTVAADGSLKSQFEQTPAAIVLANVPRLTEAQANELQRYVESGGAVLITCGSRMDVPWYNTRLFDNRSLLPARLGALKTIDSDQDGVHLQAQRFDHPALDYFNDPAHGDLTAAEFRKWFQLATASDASTGLDTGATYLPTRLADSRQDDPRAQASVLARLATGDALLLERRCGKGVVLMLTTSCDDDWNDLPLQPSFVPLMQQLVATMATRLSPQINLQTGEAAVCFYPATAEDTADSIALTLTRPDGSRQPVTGERQGDRYVLNYGDTLQPGVYRLTAADLPTEHFVTTTSRAESSLSGLTTEELDSLAGGMNAGIVSDATAYLKQDRLRRNGWEVWKIALAILLVFLFLELLLQQKFAGVRS